MTVLWNKPERRVILNSFSGYVPAALLPLRGSSVKFRRSIWGSFIDDCVLHVVWGLLISREVAKVIEAIPSH
jgi:hypothetical protein